MAEDAFGLYNLTANKTTKTNLQEECEIKSRNDKQCVLGLLNMIKYLIAHIPYAFNCALNKFISQGKCMGSKRNDEVYHD